MSAGEQIEGEGQDPAALTPEVRLALSEVADILSGALFRYVLLPDGSDRVLQVSPGLCEIYEFSPEQCEHDPAAMWATVWPEDIAEVRESVAISARLQQPWVHEWRITTPSGKTKWLQGRGLPSRRDDGSTVWTSLLFDISERRQAEQLLRLSEGRLRALLERMDSIAVQGYDSGRRVFLWNAASERLYGYTAEEAIGRQLEDLILPPEMREPVKREIEGWLSGGAPIPSAELELCDKQGRPVPVFSAHALLENTDGQPELFCVDIDLGERNRAIAALRESEARLSHVLAATGEGIWDWDLGSGRVHNNARWCEILGVEPVQLTHPRDLFLQFLHPDDRVDVLAKVQAGLDQDAGYSAEFRLLRADGVEIWVADRGRVVERDAVGAALRMVGSLTDISARKAAEQQAQFLAFFDPLTALPNRRLLEERLTRSLQQASDDGGFGALVLIDLDDFKGVNDARGHAFGDRLLSTVAQRLGGLVRGADTVARPGGDEFLLLLPQLAYSLEGAEQAALRMVERLRLALEEVVVLDERIHSASASFGVSLFPRFGDSADDVLREADTALYRAKAAGRSQIAFYSADMRGEVSSRVQLELELKHALDRSEFAVFAQPEFDCAGECIGAELLLRWQHPERGLLAPGEFIAAAERSGAIVRIGEWVLRRGCEIAVQLCAAGHALPISINVSPRQFRQADFVERVKALLARTGADPQQLIFEVTENLLIDDVVQAVERMRTLAALGIRFAIDDFGTGFSSLSYLKQLPLFQLKIDRSFVKDTPQDANDCAIVRLIISMAGSLGLCVVAEGVETREQADFLREAGCDFLQGYVFARPQPAEPWVASICARWPPISA